MDNRENILHCALNLFSLRGYDAVGVQEIVEAAGISKPTMYYYFKSKLGLLESLIEEKGSVLLSLLEQAAVREEDITAVLHVLAEAYITFAVKEFKFFYFMLGLTYSPQENEAHKAIFPLVQRQYYLLTSVFEKAAPILGNMNGRQEQFASGFLGALNCYMIVQYEKGKDMGELLEGSVIHGIVHQFLHGIFS